MKIGVLGVKIIFIFGSAGIGKTDLYFLFHLMPSEIVSFAGISAYKLRKFSLFYHNKK